MSIDAAALRVTISADSAPAERGIKSFSSKLNRAGKGFAVTGGILTGAITLPLLGIATNALSMAADFEQSMNVLQQVTGASTATMAAMNAQALALGASTVFSAGEAAAAMLELGKAGMGTSDIMASIPGVMSLAAAGGIELATAANLTANALNAFHLGASEAGRVADLLAAGANASSASIGDLGAGLQAAGFAFASANQPIENLVASLAILTNVGLTGSDAGTALKNAFMRMMNPTQEAAALIKQMGISFYDASGTMKALPDIIDMLNGALAGMTNQQRDATLSTLFMSDGMKAMIPLLDQGSTGFNKMVGEVTKVGAASDVAGARMKGLSGGLEYLSGSVDSFLIGAAQPFLGVLNNIVLSVADAITAFGGLPPTVIMATEAFLGIAAAIGPVLLVLGGLAMALASPLLPIALLIVGVVALAAAWATNIGGIQEVTATAFAPVQEWFSSTLAGAQTLAAGIATAFSNTKFPSIEALWNDFKAGDFDTIASKITSTAYTLMVNLDAELNITGKANELKAQLVGAVNSLGTAISNLDFSGATANASKMRDGILSGISGAIDSVDWAGGGATFAGMISGLTSAVSSLDFSGIDWIGVLQAALLGRINLAIRAIQWVISSDNFGGLVTAVENAFKAIPWTDLGNAFLGLGAAVMGQLSKIGADIIKDFGVALPKLPEFKMPEFKLPKMPVIHLPPPTFIVPDPAPITLKAPEIVVPKTEAPKISWTEMLSGMMDSLSTSINNFNFATVGANAADAIFGAVAGAVMAAAGAAKWAADIDQAIVGALKGIDFKGLGQTFLDINLQVGQAITDFASSFGEKARGLATSFAGLSLSVGQAITEFASGFGEQVRKIFGGGLQQIGASLGSFTLKLPELKWSDYVMAVDWISYIPTLAWDAFVAAVNWQAFIGALAWDTFVTAMGWSSFVPTVDWASFVPGISWIDFVPQINWGTFINSISWGDFVPSVNWRDFIPFFGGGGGGGTPSGGGQDNLPAGPHAAGGMDYWRGGRLLVGERGPELVDLPRGSSVYSHQDSMAMAGGGTTVNIYANVASDIDVESLANRVARVISRKQR